MKAEIETTGPGQGSVRLDNKDISSAVRSLTLEAGVDHPPRLTLDLLVFNGSTALGGVEVHLPQATVDVLIALGWTPPGEAT